MSSNAFILALKYVNCPGTKRSVESIPNFRWVVFLEKGKKQTKRKQTLVYHSANKKPDKKQESAYMRTLVSTCWWSGLGWVDSLLSRSSAEMKGMWGKHQQAGYSKLLKCCLDLCPGTCASSVASLRNQWRVGTANLLCILSSVLLNLHFP